MRTHAATVPDLTAAMLPGPYRVPAYRASGHIRLTNKTPCGTYRAPGRYKSTFVRERLLDAIAAKIGIDAVEIRRRNLIAKSAMPYALRFSKRSARISSTTPATTRGCSTRRCRPPNGTTRRQMHAHAARAGEKVGAGVAMFVEKSGLGPFDKVRVEIDADGSIEVDHRRRVDRTRCRDRDRADLRRTLGVDYPRVRVIHGQTDRIDARHGRVRLTRDRDVRRGHAAGGRQIA